MDEGLVKKEICCSSKYQQQGEWEITWLNCSLSGVQGAKASKEMVTRSGSTSTMDEGPVKHVCSCKCQQKGEWEITWSGMITNKNDSVVQGAKAS